MGLRRFAAGAVAVCVIAALGLAMNRLSLSTREESAYSAAEAVRRSAALCYALEGSYPQDINYLQKHYGLYLNSAEFVYHYRYLGDNLLPEVAVCRVKANG